MGFPEVEIIAKAALAVGGLIGGIWAVWRKYAKWRKAETERKRLEAKAIRYLLDATRQALHALVVISERGRIVNHPQLVRHRALIGHMSDELFVLDGHEPDRERRRSLERLDEAMEILTRTQAIQLRARDGDMLAPLRKQDIEQDMFRKDDIE